MKTGAELIAAERNRQLTREGWSAEHDDEHQDDDMAMAAVCYATPHKRRSYERRIEWSPLDSRMPDTGARVPRAWPWAIEWWKPTPEDRVRELVKAGALIAAEIDRLQRMAPKETSR